MDPNKEKREKRAALLKRAKQLLDGAEAEKRNLMAGEQREYNEAIEKADGLQVEIDAHEAKEMAMIRARMGERHDGDPLEIRAVRPNQSLRELVHVDDSGPRIAQVIRALATGDTRDLDTGVGGSGGGFMVTGAPSIGFIDKARALSRVVQAGTLTTPMETQELPFARVLADPVASWHEENQSDITDNSLAFERAVLHAKTLAVLAQISVELVEDSDSSAIVEGILASALAVELDRACLFGAATATEPMGIADAGQTGVQRIPGVGTLAGYSPFSYAVQLIRESNGEPGAVIYSPNTAGVLDRLVDGDDNPLTPPASFEGLKKLHTTQVSPDGGHLTAVVGDYSKAVIGMRTAVTLEASRFPGLGTLSVWIRCYLRADIVLTQPTHFCVLEDIDSEEYTS